MPQRPARSSLRDRLLNYFRVEEGELEPTLWLSFYLMLGMASVVCLKAVSDSVFLSVFDAKRLPYVDLTITALVGAVVGFYLRLSNRFPLGRLIVLTQVFLVLSLFLFWVLLLWEVRAVPALIYVWVGIFAVMIPSQVWSLSGTVFNTRQAKRLFSLIGSGGILGAALGGNFAGFVGPAIGTEYILLATAGFLMACAAIASRLSRLGQSSSYSSDEPGKGRASIWESFRVARSSRYLVLITLAIFLSTVVGTLIKYQFKAAAQLDLGADRDALTSFYGYFYGYIAVFSFLFHTVFTSRLLRWLGLSWCLFILPFALFGGSVVLLFSTTLGAAIVARGSDQGFRHSVDRAMVELLYIPLPADTRRRVKSFMDMVVSRSADGLASVVLLLLVSGLQVGIGQISWASLLFIAPWLFVVAQLRQEYVGTLRSTIERKDIRAETLLRNLAESAPAQQLEDTLQGSDQRSIETAIDWMQFSGATAAQAHLASLLNHESSAIRRKAMGVVAANHIPGCETEALGFLELEDDVEARWQALDYLESQDEQRAATAMVSLLESTDRHLAATVAARMLHRPEPEAASADTVFFTYLEWAAGADGSSRAAAARLIGLAPPSKQLSGYLSRCLRDPDLKTVRAALMSAASVKPWDEIPLIMETLADRRVRREARQALAAFQEPILPTLSAALHERKLAPRVRLEIPRIMGAIGGQQAADLLVEQLREPDHGIRHLALRALSRIRQRQGRLRFPRDTIENLLVDELRGYYQEAIFWDGIPGDGLGGGVLFLRRALKERLARRTDDMFHLLALMYPQREMLDAYHWIVSGRPDLRSNALEFLDTRLDNPVRQMLLPAIENSGSLRIYEAGRELFGLERLPYPKVLSQLLDLPDSWLQSLASYAVAELKMTELGPRLQSLTLHTNPLLRETAAAAQQRLAAGGQGDGPGSATRYGPPGSG